MRDRDLTRRTVLGATAGLAASTLAAGASRPAAAQQTVTVELVDFAFEPGTEQPLTVPPGTTVEFVWKTPSHNIVVESQPDGANWGGHEPIESQGFETEHTFETTGEYSFYCQPHRSLGMEGTIVVEEGASVGGGGSGGDGDGGGGGKKRPDFGGWLEGIDGGYTDARGQSEVTVKVGADGNTGSFAFDPAGLWVDPGTTVKWEWTGSGGGHNVVAEEGPAPLDSGETVSDAGVHYEHTFEEGGITTYFCEPHKSLGMKGAVAVGGDVPTVSAGGSSGGGSEGREFPAPGGELGFAFMVLMLGIPAIAVLSVFVGELFGSVRNRTDGPRSAYTVGIGAALLGVLFLVGITVQLLVGA